MRSRSPFLTQLFAFSGSNLSTFIAHDELAEGDGYIGQFGGGNWIAFYYLTYTIDTAINFLRDDDDAVIFPVTSRWTDWSMNLKTQSWQYDPASAALDPPSEEDTQPFPSHLPPLRQDNLRQLDANEIVVHVEEILGDALCLVASWEWRWNSGLSGCARHGFLTVGSVVDFNKAGILAHFPSTPPLEWTCKSSHPDVKASFSSSVPWRVDLSFRKPGDVQVTLDFGLRIRNKDRTQLQNAYLCQSLHILNDCENVRDVVYIDQVGFSLKATFYHNLTTSSTPVFLFVPPLRAKIINSMHCVPYPFSQPLFYWSHDPQGEYAIAEENWDELGIPRLQSEDWVGSHWQSHHYDFVKDHLQSRDYDLDGKEYAREYGYPELIRADPHDVRLAPIRLLDLQNFRRHSTEIPTEPAVVEIPKLLTAVSGDLNASPIRSTPLSGWSKLTEKVNATSRRQKERTKAKIRKLKGLLAKDK
ncbi:hypothetical protein PM082_004638 [Marasmius tenuissimus]|nr:hypothetical protein PM082_004638 [Marasmius tenuissimus]